MTQPAFALGARQQTAISLRMQQAVKLLQMSAQEFRQEIEQHLAANPFLEEAELPDTAASDEAEAADAPQITADDPAVFDRGEQMLEAASEPDPERADEGPDWIDADGSAFDSIAPDGGERGDAGIDACAWIRAETTLRSHLFDQLRSARLPVRIGIAAGLVIESLDDDGYLREDPATTASLLGLAEPPTAAERAAGLAAVQQFDPPGIAARDLRDCLRLQLDLLPASTPGRGLALRLVADHLARLARHDYTSLRRLLDCSPAQLTVAHGLIRTLDPKPGARLGDDRTEYIEPDVLITEVDGVLTARINPSRQLRPQLNRGCAELMRHSGSGHAALRQQLQEARWLLRNVAQRHATIQRVADAIVARQRGFFQYGEVALKPLSLRAIADELGLHESTLSRATVNKYMATPRGTYEFRHFFSRQLGTDTGGTCSAAAVRALMREMIDGESMSAPLSDVMLAQKLGASGIRVARRTVAKYRNQMKVPPWELRHLP